MSVSEYIQLPVFQRAFLAALVAGATISLLGVVIIMLNLTTIRFALMHLGLLGGDVGLALGSTPFAGATIAIVLGSLLFGPFSDKLRLDTGIVGAFFMTGSIAVAEIARCPRVLRDFPGPEHKSLQELLVDNANKLGL